MVGLKLIHVGKRATGVNYLAMEAHVRTIQRNNCQLGVVYWIPRHCLKQFVSRLLFENSDLRNFNFRRQLCTKRWWSNMRFHVLPPELRVLLTEPFNTFHFGRDKMTTIFQTTLSNAFYWRKIYEFRLRIHLILFLGVQLPLSQHWFR